MEPILTREQVRQVDRIAAEEYHISGLVLMENAGHNATQIILQEMADRLSARGTEDAARVLIFCGTGNNGGDGFVIARHLDNAGVNVAIAMAGEPDRLAPDAAANHRICVAMELPIVDAVQAEIRPRDLDHLGLLLEKLEPGQQVPMVFLRHKEGVATRIDMNIALP